MKYRILGLIMILIMISAALFATLAERSDGKKGTGKRYHQHIEEDGFSPCDDHGDDVFCSHLPLIFIETGGKEIPGDVAGDVAGGATGNMVGEAADGTGERTLSVTLSVTDQKNINHHIEDKPDMTESANIRIRGNSSRYYDKKGYLIKITEADGLSSKNVSMLGMDAHDEWVLHGPYLDKSLIRNYMWYNIAGEIMDYAPNVRFCEVFIDGEYKGLYVLTETITNGKNCRLHLAEPLDGAKQTGYALRLDRGSTNEQKNIETFSQYALRNLQEMNIVWPGGKKLTQVRRDYIPQDFSDFEKALYSYDYDSKQYGLYQWIDQKSFIDYFLINEFTCNYDAGWLSTYVYRDLEGKFKMCIWDFNSACNNYIDDVASPYHFEMQYAVWYFMLVKEEEFDQAIIDRYRQLRKTWLGDEYLTGYIDDTTDWLGPAIDRNFQVWGYTFEENMLKPASRNLRSHEEAVGQLRDFCLERGAWMDEYIEILKQYGHPSKVKKFNH